MKKTIVLIALVTAGLYAQYPNSVGRYTGKNWGQWIDTTWGQGISTAQKLDLFDLFWTTVDQTYAGFPNLTVNWDSLKNVYRPQIAAGVSRGRFYGIMSRLTMALNEWHVYAVDAGIDSSFKLYSLSEYPVTSFAYKPGIPLFNSNELWFQSSFGSGVTSLPDSTALVYSVMPNHPLGLQPGDIILGYNGIPWKNLLKEILDAELPVTHGGASFGSSLNVNNHMGIMSVGLNWGLFDTIDVFKYSSKETVHFPSSLLSSVKSPYPIATEQLPVKGVPFPNLDAKQLVSWGVVEGTTVGYIYAWDWYGVPVGNTDAQFGQAVSDLIFNKQVTGLVLDCRTNWGGGPRFANTGLSILFNEDPTSKYSVADRALGGDHFAFTYRPAPAIHTFTPTPYVFDHPIAVLTGPNCGSAGDYNAFRLRFHPMTRIFGRPTNGAFTYNLSPDYSYAGSYYYSLPRAAIVSNVNNEGILDHIGNPIDEEIWLTQEGVAKGEDDVVKRALEWISTTAHAYDPIGTFFTLNNDSVLLRVKVKNPMNDSLTIVGILNTTGNVVLDSAYFFNDGLHADGAAGDSVWGCFLPRPAGNVTLTYAIKVRNKTLGTVRQVSYKIPITTGIVADMRAIPTEFGLEQNYPNPFNPSTTIRFSLPVGSHVRMVVYNLLGQVIAELVNETLTAGVKQVMWNAAVPSGVYMYRLDTATRDGKTYSETRRMVLVR